MPILERHEGCPATSGEECFGPSGSYWTFLGTPTHLLWIHALIALMVAALLLLALVVLRRRGHLALGAGSLGATTAAAATAVFLLAALLVPIDPQY